MISKKTLRESKHLLRQGQIYSFHRGRLFFVFALMIAGFALLAGNLLRLQYVKRAFLVQKAESQQTLKIPLAAARGQILDRNGWPLAISVERYSLYADLQRLSVRPVDIGKVARAISMSEEEVVTLLASGRGTVALKRKLDEKESNAVRDLNLRGLYLAPEGKRFYPNGELAGQILGFVGVDNDGLEGLEREFDSVLRGAAGRKVIEADAHRRPLETDYLMSDFRSPIPGHTIVLSIDERIQHIMERELQRVYEETQPAGTWAVATNPRTGEILAMASYPGYDPNLPAQTSGEARRLKPLTDLFEPGSAFKIVTAASALEEHRITPDDLIDCEGGRYRFAGGRRVTDYHHMGVVPFHEVISQSSNIGAIKVAERVGPSLFCQYLEGMGFGHLTGVRFPGEVTGLARKPNDRLWSKLTMSSLPMGYEIQVTALQLALGLGVVANDGVYVSPRLVTKIVDSQGNLVEEFPVPTKRRAFSSSTATTLGSLLREVVVSGTGKRAETSKFAVAGKTGTSQKRDPITGQYDSSRHMSIFSGYLPYEDPRLLMVIVVDMPHTKVDTGGMIAAPVFKNVAEQVTEYLDIPLEQKILPSGSGVQRLSSAEHVSPVPHDSIEGEVSGRRNNTLG